MTGHFISDRGDILEIFWSVHCSLNRLGGEANRMFPRKGETHGIREFAGWTASVPAQGRTHSPGHIVHGERSRAHTEIVFAVNFGTRQLEHFLPPAADAGGGRAVQHDPATWASEDTSPVESICTMEDLRATLYCLQGAAVEWYPRAAASVFNAVHTDSLAGLYDDAPESLVHAVINLHSHVFTVLFNSINDGRHGSLLERDARSIMAHDSPDYIRMVRHVIKRALIRAWVHSGSSAATGSHLNTRRQRRERTTTSPVPLHILRLISTHNGKAICLRSQTQTGCSFRSCKHPHEKVQLPEVTSYVTSKYGALATDHPNLRH